jgi:hypothetical protein
MRWLIMIALIALNLSQTCLCSYITPESNDTKCCYVVSSSNIETEDLGSDPLNDAERCLCDSRWMVPQISRSIILDSHQLCDAPQVWLRSIPHLMPSISTRLVAMTGRDMCARLVRLLI